MKTVAVENAERIAGYGSFDAAVAGAEGNPRQSKARTDGQAFLGRSFVDALCGSHEWVLKFSGPLWLRVRVEGTKVDWSVEDAEPPVRPSDDPVAFDWGAAGVSVPNHSALVDSRRGAEFWQLYVNECGFFVYLRRKLILVFHAVRRLDNGEIVLYVTEDD